MRRYHKSCYIVITGMPPVGDEVELRTKEYHEFCNNAQEAVDKVRSYTVKQEHILRVYKRVTNWK